MTKLAFVADVHLGNHKVHGGEAVASLNVRCRLGLDVFRRAVIRAAKRRCDGFFVLGDLFDYQRPEAQLLTEVQGILGEDEHAEMKKWLLVGNHDQTSTARGDHALGPLAPFATIVDRPTAVVVRDVAVGLVPFVAGHVDDWIADAVRDAARVAGDLDYARQILGVHLGIADDDTPGFLSRSEDAIRVEAIRGHASTHGFSKVLAGNWHNRRLWSAEPPEVFQLGALVPTGFDNPGLEGYGTLAIWEDGKLSFEEITGPRFIGTTPELAAEFVEKARALGHAPFLRVTAPPLDLAAVRAFVESLGVVADVLPDATDITVAARSAATNARAANTVDDALAGFVEVMILPENVDRADVLARSKRYLRRIE